MDNSQITVVEFCAGYAGISLGLKRVLPGLRVIAYSEIEAYACANLVTKMEAGLLDSAPIWSDLKTFPCESFRGLVDILCGGYPCQGESVAGKKMGKEDHRWIWPYIRRAIHIIRPRVCFLENVEGHISGGLRSVLTDFHALGYCVENRRKEPTWGIFSAEEVGAPHRRKRVCILAVRKDLAKSGRGFLSDARRGSEGRTWIRSAEPDLADSELISTETRRPDEPLRSAHQSGDGHRNDGGELGHAENHHGGTEQPTGKSTGDGRARPSGASGDVSNAALVGLEVGPGEHGNDGQKQPTVERDGLPEFPPGPNNRNAWREILEIDPTLEPAVCCVAHGSSSRMDELRLAGNGVVPATVAKAFRVLIARVI